MVFVKFLIRNSKEYARYSVQSFGNEEMLSSNNCQIEIFLFDR